MPVAWEAALDALAQRYGKMPDEIASRPWSVLTRWLMVAGFVDVEVAE